MKAKRYEIPLAVHLFLRRGDEVLLLQRANTGYQDGAYGVVAGHVDEGERATYAMIREAEEEAGIKIAPEDLHFACTCHRLSEPEEGRDPNIRIDYFYECRKWTGTVTNTEPHKCSDLSFFPLEALPDSLIPYIRKALETVREGKVCFELGWDEPAGC